MSDIDAALTKRFQHIISQEQWSFQPYTTPPKKLSGGGNTPRGNGKHDPIYYAAIVVFVGCLLALGYMRMPCFQR